MALVLVFQQRGDLAYGLSSTTASDLGSIASLVDRPSDSLPVNRYVRLTGLPDRESAVILDTKGSWKFAQFFRLLASDSRFFVRRVADPVPLDLADRDVFTGRLIRFEDLSFQASIRAHFLAHITASHFFAPSAVATVLAAAPAAGGYVLADLAGEKLTLKADDHVVLDRARPDEVEIRLPKDRYPTLETARAIVENQGGRIVAEGADARATPLPDSSTFGSARGPVDSHVLVVTFPADRRDLALSAIGDLDRRVKIRPARSTFRVRLGDVSVLAGAPATRLSAKLASGQSVEMPLAEVQSVRTLAPVKIPANALLLLEGERPGDHLKTIVIAAFLLAFAAVNLLSLRRPTGNV
jgi:hypothetical protein